MLVSRFVAEFGVVVGGGDVGFRAAVAAVYGST